MELAELAEPVAYLELLVSTNCFAYPRGDHTMVFRELRLAKQLDELAKLGDDWNYSAVWSCTKELAKCSEHEFLINFQSDRIL